MALRLLKRRVKKSIKSINHAQLMVIPFLFMFLTLSLTLLSLKFNLIIFIVIIVLLKLLKGDEKVLSGIEKEQDWLSSYNERPDKSSSDLLRLGERPRRFSRESEERNNKPL